MKKFLAVLIGLATSLCAEPAQQSLRVVTWNLQWFPGGRLGASKEDQDKQIVRKRPKFIPLNVALA